MIGVFIGTRPELIKLRPIFYGLRKQLEGMAPVRVIYIRQHQAIEAEVMSLDPDCHRFTTGGGSENIGRTIKALENLTEYLPDLRVGVVQGDTSAAAGAALALAYQRIPVVHVEAGLRTEQTFGKANAAPHTAPFPEELNRQLISRIASLHLAPTYRNEQRLLAEQVGGQVTLTGNPGISNVVSLIENYNATITAPEGTDGRPNILVTCHRRENWRKLGELGEELRLVVRKTGAHIFWIRHPNPELRGALAAFEHDKDFTLLDPLPWLPMIGMIMNADVIATDSGGILEEATWLRKHVVVLRRETERPEAANAIVHEIHNCHTSIVDIMKWPEPSEGSRYSFGDGQSAMNCINAIVDFYHRGRHEAGSTSCSFT